MKKAPQFRWIRRIVQMIALILIALIPASGLLKIDLTTASFSILGNQVLWSNFILISGLALIFATIPILTYMTIGSLWCGWACPQNLVSEWANNLTAKLLGKRASVEVGGAGMTVAASKNKFVNWAILGVTFMGASLVLAIIPFFFFYSSSEIWSILTISNSDKISPFILYIFAVLLIFIDIAVMRYFVCDYACFYRMGQRMFKSKDALRVTYDATRSSDCTKCNYCATVCITSIQPTNISEYDTCINCGECIDACNRLHMKANTTGLLDFELSSNTANPTTWQKFRRVFSQINWFVLALFLFGTGLTAWGIATQPKPQPKVSLAVLTKAREVARICNEQCAKPEAACKNKSIEGCYRASACRCECSLQQDPGNPAAHDWKLCVSRNLANAETQSKLPGNHGAVK